MSSAASVAGLPDRKTPQLLAIRPRGTQRSGIKEEAYASAARMRSPCAIGHARLMPSWPGTAAELECRAGLILPPSPFNESAAIVTIRKGQ